MKGNRHFTLTELLVAIAVILILYSLLNPVLFRSQEVSDQLICAHNIKNVGTRYHLMGFDHNGFYEWAYQEPFHLPRPKPGVKGIKMNKRATSTRVEALMGRYLDGEHWRGIAFSLLTDYDLKPESLDCPDLPSTAMDRGHSLALYQDEGRHPLDVGYWGRPTINADRDLREINVSEAWSTIIDFQRQGKIDLDTDSLVTHHGEIVPSYHYHSVMSNKFTELGKTELLARNKRLNLGYYLHGGARNTLNQENLSPVGVDDNPNLFLVTDINAANWGRPTLKHSAPSPLDTFTFLPHRKMNTLLNDGSLLQMPFRVGEPLSIIYDNAYHPLPEGVDRSEHIDLNGDTQLLLYGGSHENSLHLGAFVP